MQKPSASQGIAISQQSSGQLFGRLWRGYLRKHLGWILLAMLLMIIEGSTLGLLSYMLQPMFDVVFVDGNSDQAYLIALAIFALFAVRGISGLAQRVLMTRTALKASTELQVDLLGHTLDLDNGFHSKSSPGALIERVMGDVVSIQGLWNIIVTGTGRDVISLLSLMIVAISIDWKWAAIAVIGAPLLLLPSIIVQRYIRRKSQYLREVAGRRTTRLDEIFHGVTPIKLNRMERYQRGHFSNISNDWVRASVKAAAGQATVPSLVDIAVGFGFFCVLIYGGPQIASGEKTVGQFMSFFAAMSLAFQPLRRLADVAGYWQIMSASLARIFGLMDTQAEVKDNAPEGTPLPKTNSVRFDKVSLAYGDLPVLKELSFEVPEGTTTALVGQSGAGKSTVFNVLTRLIDAQEGHVQIGETKTTDLKLAQLRGLFSVVSQEALLFDETLRENIILGRTDVSDEDLKDVLDAANVSQFLGNLPNGLDTQVGPRGTNLSGGQRQRVAIARALLRDTPILLLDEATSALDAESEKVVQDALDRLAKGRTTLVIAHRLSTVRNADQILVLEQGELAEAGTHEELIKHGGLYSNLHSLQFRTPEPRQTYPAPDNTPDNAAAIAVLPVERSAGIRLGSISLDALVWPLGRPNRLAHGTVADMEGTDHLILPERSGAYWRHPFLRVNLSLLAKGPRSKAPKHATKFHRVLTDDEDLTRTLPNARLIAPGSSAAEALQQG